MQVFRMSPMVDRLTRVETASSGAHTLGVQYSQTSRTNCLRHAPEELRVRFFASLRSAQNDMAGGRLDKQAALRQR